MIKDKFKRGLSGFIKPKKVENKKTIGDLLNTLRTSKRGIKSSNSKKKKPQNLKNTLTYILMKILKELFMDWFQGLPRKASVSKIRILQDRML